MTEMRHSHRIETHEKRCGKIGEICIICEKEHPTGNCTRSQRTLPLSADYTVNECDVPPHCVLLHSARCCMFNDARQVGTHAPGGVVSPPGTCDTRIQTSHDPPQPGIRNRENADPRRSAIDEIVQPGGCAEKTEGI
jgi:hypothetical protein